MRRPKIEDEARGPNRAVGIAMMFQLIGIWLGLAFCLLLMAVWGVVVLILALIWLPFPGANWVERLANAPFDFLIGAIDELDRHWERHSEDEQDG